MKGAGPTFREESPLRSWRSSCSPILHSFKWREVRCFIINTEVRSKLLRSGVAKAVSLGTESAAAVSSCGRHPAGWSESKGSHTISLLTELATLKNQDRRENGTGSSLMMNVSRTGGYSRWIAPQCLFTKGSRRHLQIARQLSR